jgi:uncharacterized membrane protein
MPAQNHVENPFEYVLERATWMADDIRRAFTAPIHRHVAEAPPKIRRIEIVDLKDALIEGWRDLGVVRSDAVFLAVIYPLAGLVLAAVSLNLNLLPLVLPLVSGFAVLGPIAAVGVYEVSRRLEAGQPVSAATPFEVLRSPSFSSILGMGAILAMIFILWLFTAWGIYAMTLGPKPPASIGSFLHDVFTTWSGFTMVVVGMAVGFIFAAVSYTISVVSVPLLLDRDVGVGTAIRASLQAVAENPGPMATWGAVIAGALILGSIPALAGLIVVMPLFGHASWRLYRRLVEPQE